MNDGIIQLTYWQISLAYIFILLVLFILKKRQINRDKILIIATVRMSVQLIVVGYVLMVIIDNPNPWITFLIIAVMLGFAIYTVFSKFKGSLDSALKKTIIFSLPTGTMIALSYFLFIVINIEPFYDPQYFIPIAGMIIGNSMTGITLGIHTMLNKFTDQKAEIEEALHLGATPKSASKPIVDEAFDASIMPTVNNMLGMGIIFLPGMMTGQILSGVNPSTAIMYQIGIMLGIFGGVSLSTYLFLITGYKTFFNHHAQLNR